MRRTPGTSYTYRTWDRKLILFASYRLCTSVVSAYRAIVLASLLSCATQAFSVDSTFCAHSLVARPHLSIRACVSVCHSLLLVYLFHLRICESFPTLLTLANILHQIFVPLSSPSSTISLTCVGVRNGRDWYQLFYFLVTSLSDH